MRGRSGRASGWFATVLFAAATAAADAPDAKFTLTSPDIAPGGPIANAQVYNRYGCMGDNISPALSWSHAPAGTRSFALLVHDPDAATGSGWWHWVLYNLPANTSSLPAGAGDVKKTALPPGAVQGRTDFGTADYGGPCPPPGAPHRYHFRLYALKVAQLDLPGEASAALVETTVRAQALGSAELTGIYGN